MSDQHSLFYGREYKLAYLMDFRGKRLVTLAEEAKIPTRDLRNLVDGVNTRPVSQHVAQRIATALDVEVNMVIWPRGIAKKPTARSDKTATSRTRIPGSVESTPCKSCGTMPPLMKASECPTCGAPTDD